MSRYLSIFFILIVSISLLLFWGSTRRTPFLEKGMLVEVGIENIEFYYQDQKLILMVELNKPLTCSEISKLLGIESVVVKNITYRPECNVIDASHSTIVYRQHE